MTVNNKQPYPSPGVSVSTVLYRRVARWAAVALMLLCPPAHAGTGVVQLERFLQDVTSLKASFEQSVLDPEHQSAIRSQGLFYLQRPGRFRWDYSEPEGQMILADGRQIWHHDPELDQVSVQGQESALKGTPAMLLISGDPVASHFEVIDIGDRQSMGWVELIPRDPESQFTRILLAFTADTLRRMEMADKFGQVTRFQFYDIELNPPLAQSLFYFRPGHGLDIFKSD
ncbi:MAG: outer membrane lipoprotein chaperone LolA [Candidatus Sedimenticola endophacoides]